MEKHSDREEDRGSVFARLMMLRDERRRDDRVFCYLCARAQVGEERALSPEKKDSYNFLEPRIMFLWKAARMTLVSMGWP